MSIIPNSQNKNRMNILFNQRNDNANNDNQYIDSKNRNIVTLLNNEKIEKVIETKIAFLRTNVRKILIAKKNRFCVVVSRMFETIIVELFFVLTKNVNTLSIAKLIDIQSTNDNVNKFSTNNDVNNKNMKIEIVSLKAKKLKLEKIKSYFDKFKKKHTY